MDVLVTGVGSTTSQSVIKGLRKQSKYDTRVVGVDINPADMIAGSRFCDEFYTVPFASEEEMYTEALLDISRSENIDLVIPIVDIELSVLAKYADKIRAETELLLSSRETIKNCNEKSLTYKFFKSAGIPTPKTVNVDSSASDSEIHSQISDLQYPFIIKPNTGVSSRDVYEIQNAEVLRLIRRDDDQLAYDKVTGAEYPLNAFRNGKKTVSAVPRKRVETRAGISYKGETVRDKELINFGKKIADELQIYGPANIQCFKDGGEIQFFEVNPRFSGSLPLSIKSGRNSVCYSLQLIRDDPIEIQSDFEEVRMCRSWDEVYHRL
jgi:carbamoyl-phosphate synthase large subunit